MLGKLSPFAAAALFALSPVAVAQERLAGIAPSVESPRVTAPVWYPGDCTWIDYCAPVDYVFWRPSRDGREPQLMMTSLHGTATVQRIFPVQESRDRKVHVCMRFDPFGDLEVTCLLVPAF